MVACASCKNRVFCKNIYLFVAERINEGSLLSERDCTDRRKKS
jgi:hypothetical protein